jgi:hypothetical protein
MRFENVFFSVRPIVLSLAIVAPPHQWGSFFAPSGRHGPLERSALLWL